MAQVFSAADSVSVQFELISIERAIQGIHFQGYTLSGTHLAKLALLEACSDPGRIDLRHHDYCEPAAMRWLNSASRCMTTPATGYHMEVGARFSFAWSKCALADSTAATLLATLACLISTCRGGCESK
jgi:hypothetical protein